MAYNSKTNNTGSWYNNTTSYNLPPQPQVKAPPTSQIPGIGGVSGGPPDERKQWIKDTDSDYVKLAKQGGHSNLLSNDSNPAPASSAKPTRYPRVDWFYQDDIKENAQAGQPQTRQRGTYDAAPQRPAPYDNSYVEKPKPSDALYTDIPRSTSYNGSQYNGSQYNGSQFADRAHPPSESKYADRSQAPFNATRGGQPYEGRYEDEPEDRYDDRYADEHCRAYPDDSPRDDPFQKSYSDSPSQSLRNPDMSGGGADPRQRLYGANGDANNNNTGAYVPTRYPPETTTQFPVDVKERYPLDANQQQNNRTTRQDKPSAGSDMSKIMSFGYYHDWEGEQNKQRRGEGGSRGQRSSDVIGSGAPETEYAIKDVRIGGRGRPPSGSVDSRSTSATARQTPNYDTHQAINRRKKADDDTRPDFFNLGASSQQRATPQYGRRKNSDAERPEFFASNGGGYTPSVVSTTIPMPPATHGYGRPKPEKQAKPDFFSIGSSQYSDLDRGRPETHDNAMPDYLDKVHGLGGQQRTSYGRKKMDLEHSMMPMKPK